MQGSALQCSEVQCSAVQHSVVQCIAVLGGAVKCSAILCRTMSFNAVHRCSPVKLRKLQCITEPGSDKRSLHFYISFKGQVGSSNICAPHSFICNILATSKTTEDPICRGGGVGIGTVKQQLVICSMERPTELF